MRTATMTVVAASLVMAGAAAAQTGGRPPSAIRIPQAQPAVAGAPQPSQAAMAAAGAMASQLEVNVLKGQVAALQKQLGEMQTQLAALQTQQTAQGKTVEGLKQSMATVSLKGITNANDIVAANAQIEALKTADVEAKKTFDSHSHYEFFTTFQDNLQQFQPRLSSIPSVYCSKNLSESGFSKVKCNGPN